MNWMTPTVVREVLVPVNLDQWSVEPISFKSARAFVQAWHKMPNVNGLHVTQCYGLFRPPDFCALAEPLRWMCGVIMYGTPAMSSQAKKWCPQNPSQLLEIRRLCFWDDCEDFAKTFFINNTLSLLRHNTNTTIVVAYTHADEGDIYRATNGKMVGTTAPGRILMVDGKRYHDRTLRVNKPYARKIKHRLKEGDANVKLVDTPPKHIFLYRLRKVNTWDEK
ncbi:hypothetical protein LCGC14_2413760 [marine sediment metagenome]|uniref:Uncharacterized protein n=1 Tax=marine sediment metagenome TaxID=412755 RepID=A0A0F9BRR4_9ZZZZ